jgi:hypothetical protein
MKEVKRLKIKLKRSEVKRVESELCGCERNWQAQEAMEEPHDEAESAT